VERHDAIITTLQLLPYAEAALQKICQWDSPEARSSADLALRGVAEFGFVISVRHLQTPGMDVIKALADIVYVQKALAQLRDEAEVEFGAIYAEAVEMCSKLDVTVKKPRCPKRSTHRDTAGAADQDTETYYRVNMFLPLLDGLAAHVTDRFGATQQKCMALGRLVPAHLGTFADIEPAVDIYASLLDSKLHVKGEFDLWKQQWSNSAAASLVDSGIVALDNCPRVTMPNINKLLHVLTTLPVTTAEAERVFSKVERTATAARAHMSEDRLEALVMLYAHRNRTPSVGKVIGQFALSGARRLHLLL